MERSDARLIDYIQRASRGGSMLLRTLGVRGKALERDDPERAALLLAAVRSHPLYKGGRLAFDMLELEDLMLDASSVTLLDDVQLAQLLSAVTANAQNIVAAILGLGAGERDGAGAQTPATFLPRISFGPASDSLERSSASDNDNGAKATEPEPHLLSSDYLYDYVVLGFLDRLGRQIPD